MENCLLKKSLYRFFETGDGSPSVFFTNGEGVEEAMHNRHGALTETEYIYGSAMDLAMTRFSEIKALSLGLGIGYVEMLMAAKSLVSAKRIELYTFERQPELVENFAQWLAGDEQLAKEWRSAYERAGTMLAANQKCGMGQIQQTLLQWKNQKMWKCLGAVENSIESAGDRFNLVFYDAFSKKMSPELWQLDVLGEVLSRTEVGCIFVTYAVNSSLKQALRSHGFSLEKRPGFAHKRESTLAIREI